MAKAKKPAEVLRAAMKGRGLGPAALSKASGVDSGLIGRYVRGESNIGPRNAPRLAEALGIEVVALLYGERAA